jgi:hypothetical protein
MEMTTKTANQLILRIIAIVLHAILNFIAVSYITDIDLTGSWIVFIGFVLILIFLSYLFIKHLVSFINYITSK